METTLLWLIAGLLFYQALISKAVFRALTRLEGESPVITNVRVLFARISGGIFLGLMAYSADGYGPDSDLNTFRSWTGNLPYLTAAAILILVLMFFAFRSEKNRSGYPQLQFKHWTSGIFTMNIMTWGFYLFSYEWLWRGTMIRLLSTSLPSWSVLLITTAGYSVYHLFKTRREAAGAIPMGLLLGFLTIHSGSFLPAFLLHWVFACGSEAICLYHAVNPTAKTSLS